jgi:uncharacterized protein YigE (DUF2233 family)
MKKKFAALLLLAIASMLFFQFTWKSLDDDFVSYTVNPKKETISFYYKDEKQVNFQSLNNLKLWLNKNQKELLFAMNGGMYKKDKTPQGLFIENEITKFKIDTVSADGNFYLKPNGVFYLTDKNEAKVVTTPSFVNNKNIKFATQSGPMLVIDGTIHPAFKKGSSNLNIRNGVGILPNGQVIFAMSKKEINFYDFADFFRQKGCKNALYLDGFVSRAYCPNQKWIQTDGDFGVIIGVTKK